MQSQQVESKSRSLKRRATLALTRKGSIKDAIKSDPPAKVAVPLQDDAPPAETPDLPFATRKRTVRKRLSSMNFRRSREDEEVRCSVGSPTKMGTPSPPATPRPNLMRATSNTQTRKSSQAFPQNESVSMKQDLKDAISEKLMAAKKSNFAGSVRVRCNSTATRVWDLWQPKPIAKDAPSADICPCPSQELKPIQAVNIPCAKANLTSKAHTIKRKPVPVWLLRPEEVKALWPKGAFCNPEKEESTVTFPAGMSAEATLSLRAAASMRVKRDPSSSYFSAPSSTGTTSTTSGSDYDTASMSSMDDEKDGLDAFDNESDVDPYNTTPWCELVAEFPFAGPGCAL